MVIGVDIRNVNSAVRRHSANYSSIYSYSSDTQADTAVHIYGKWVFV